MSTTPSSANLPATTASQTQAVARLLAKADELEAAASSALQLLDIQGGTFKTFFATSQAFKIIKAALSDDIVTEIMSLMNTSLGFRTDKDPNQVDRQGKPHIPYSIAVVRDVLVEAAIKKARWWGNEFNIIAGKLYLTKEYYERMVREFTGLTDLDARPGVPTMIGEDGALVPYFVSWKLKGKEMKMDRRKVSDIEDTRFVIRRNAAMGVDAVLGKARKRAFAAVFGILTGREDEGEDDVLVLDVTATTISPSSGDALGSQSKSTEPAAAKSTAGGTTKEIPF